MHRLTTQFVLYRVLDKGGEIMSVTSLIVMAFGQHGRNIHSLYDRSAYLISPHGSYVPVV